MVSDVTKSPVEPGRKPGRGLRIALALSVALNLAVLGVVAGALLRDGPGLHPPMARDLAFGPYTEALSRDDRKALRRALFERAPEIRDTRRKMRDETRALLDLLRATPFDPAAVKARMQDQQARMEQQLRLGQGVLQDLILAMSPEDRRAFADRLETGLRRADKKADGDHHRSERRATD